MHTIEGVTSSAQATSGTEEPNEGTNQNNGYVGIIARSQFKPLPLLGT